MNKDDVIIYLLRLIEKYVEDKSNPGTDPELGNRVSELETLKHSHSNKDELDTIVSGDKAKWDNTTKQVNAFLMDTDTTQDVIDTLAEIQEYIESHAEAAAAMVNSITTAQNTANTALSEVDALETVVANMNTLVGQMINTIYPVGSIYISTVSTSPKVLFGVGEWEQIKDRFLLGAGDTYNAGATGGEASVTLTRAQMPEHNHYLILSDQDAEGTLPESRTGIKVDYTESTTKGWSDTTAIQNRGSSEPHNNMPPYLGVYMWKRMS